MTSTLLSGALLPKLVQMIDAQGPLPLDQYMEVVLNDPEHGYYATRDPFGVAGDFITAPEISQIFGELLGLWAIDYWQKMGCPKNIHLVEIGPGRGTLMQDALKAARSVPDFLTNVRVDLVETSPSLRKIQKKTLSRFTGEMNWHDTVDTLPDAPCIILTNEFFDALPIKQFVYQANVRKRWHEKYVHHEKNKLTYCLLPVSDTNMPDLSLYPKIDAGQVIEQCPTAVNIVTKLGKHLTEYGGCLLTIDYGYAQAAAGDSFQALEKHKPVDPLARPGCADLTAHVNFAQLVETSRKAGLKATSIVTQRAFLKALGADYRFEALMQNATQAQQIDLAAARDRLMSTDQMGVLFKALALFSANQPAPIGFSEGGD